MKINFVLPSLPSKPSGGYRAVYELAGALAERGHNAEVCHIPALGGKRKPSRMAVDFLSAAAAAVYGVRVTWMKVSKKITLSLPAAPVSEGMADADVTFATSWRTAGFVASLPPSKGRKFYIVMDFAPWLGAAREIEHTWKLPLKKIAISKWMASQVSEAGETAHTITPGIDHSVFNLRKPAESRRAQIAFMYSKSPYKDAATGINAIENVRKKGGIGGGFSVVCFGPSFLKPRGIPRWFDYRGTVGDAELSGIYNDSSVFVSSSAAEGFALPPLEAMACGCAVAATDSGGLRDYAIHENNCLLCRPGDADTLGRYIEKLLLDRKLRIRMSSRGVDTARRFSWARTAESVEKALNSL